MGVLNLQPSLQKIIGDLEDRIKYLESSRRFTVPVVPDYTKYPTQPQSGDMMLDASTGYLYVFLILTGTGYSNIISSSSINISVASLTFATTNTGSFNVGDPVRIYQTGSTTNYMDGSITALTSNVSMTVNVTAIGGSGTFASWSITAFGAWRQIATYADLIAANVFLSTSSGGSATVSVSSIGGGGSGSATSGSSVGTGGTGLIRTSGYAPH